MRYLLCTILGFVAGAGITYILEEAKVERVSQQREASVREYYHNKDKKEEPEEEEKEEEPATSNYIPTDYMASSQVADDCDEDEDDQDDIEVERESYDITKPPEPISYDEFANDENYEALPTWRYDPSDDILYNADKKALTQAEIEMYVGSKNIRDAITQGLVTLYIRNERYHMDIEVNIDEG